MTIKEVKKIKRKAHIEALFISSTLIQRVVDQDSDQFEYKIIDAMKQIALSLYQRAYKLQNK